MLISVIVPAYNASKYIGEALESVFRQSVTDYEVIVINDGSTDSKELESVLLPFRSRITYIAQTNKGCGAARNTGIRVASGEYFALLDADDIWEPDYLATQISFFGEHPETDLVYPNAVYFGDNKESGKCYMDLFPSDGEVTLESLIESKCLVFYGVTVRKQAILDTGPFDESLRRCEDFDMWVRMAAIGKMLRYHRKALVKYRQHASNLSANDMAMVESKKRVLQKLPVTPLITNQLVRLDAKLNYLKGKSAFESGDFDMAAEYFSRANSHYHSAKITAISAILRSAPWILRGAYKTRAMLWR